MLKNEAGKDNVYSSRTASGLWMNCTCHDPSTAQRTEWNRVRKAAKTTALEPNTKGPSKLQDLQQALSKSQGLQKATNSISTLFYKGGKAKEMQLLWATPRGLQITSEQQNSEASESTLHSYSHPTRPTERTKWRGHGVSCSNRTSEF